MRYLIPIVFVLCAFPAFAQVEEEDPCPAAETGQPVKIDMRSAAEAAQEVASNSGYGVDSAVDSRAARVTNVEGAITALTDLLQNVRGLNWNQINAFDRRFAKNAAVRFQYRIELLQQVVH